jgi:uncharacterized coiled-coil DUF342 family protein
MKTNDTVQPASLERLLGERSESADSEASIESLSPEQLDPRHLLAIATTTDNGLNNLADEIDWDAFIDILGELDEEAEMRLLVRLVRHLGTRTTAGIDSAAGIEAIGDRVHELRYDHPNVFLAFLHELNSLLRRDSSTEAVRAAEEVFRQVAAEDDRVSSERVKTFRERDIRSRLVDPTISPEAVVSLLETLQKESPADVPTEMLIDLLYPLRNQYDADVEAAALRTIESWAAQFSDATDDTVETLESFLAGERNDLPPLLMMELVAVGYVAPAIVEWLVDLPRIEERQAVVTAAFDTLETISGIRDSSEQLCSFLLDAPLEERAMHAGIDMLGSILVGLVPYQRTENPVQEDHFKQLFFTDEELSVDEIVRETLQQITNGETYPSEVRAHAARTWLSVRPPEIHEALWEIDPSKIGEDPVVDAKLEAAANHRLVEFVDAIEEFWESAEPSSNQMLSLVETLDELETQDIIRVMLTPAFDYDDQSVREAARDALVESGYEAEVKREAKRRNVLDRIAARYDTMSDATETDREIRDRTGNQLATEENRKQKRLESSRATARSVDTLTNFRSEGATNMLRLGPLFDALEEIEAHIKEVVRQVEQLESEIESEYQKAQRIADDIEQTEREIDTTENDLDQARSRKQELENRIQELKRDIIPGLEREVEQYEDKIRQVKKKIREVERKEPSKPIRETEENVAKYKRQMDQWQSEMRSLERDLQSLQSDRDSTQRELNNARDERRDCQSELGTVESNISQLESKLRSLRDDHRELCGQLDASQNRIDQHRARVEELADELTRLREEYEKYKSRIDSIVSELQSIRSRATSKHRQLANQSQQAREDAADLRDQLGLLASSQADARDRRADLIDRVASLTDRLEVDHDEFESLGNRTETETPTADTEAYDRATDTEDAQYESNVAKWRLDSILRRSVEREAVSKASEDTTARVEQRLTEVEER